MVRALTVYAGQPGGYVWTLSKLIPIIEAEQGKVVSGKLPAKKSHQAVSSLQTWANSRIPCLQAAKNAGF